jgi:hypothetical protein
VGDEDYSLLNLERLCLHRLCPSTHRGLIAAPHFELGGLYVFKKETALRQRFLNYNFSVIDLADIHVILSLCIKLHYFP